MISLVLFQYLNSTQLETLFQYCYRNYSVHISEEAIAKFIQQTNIWCYENKAEYFGLVFQDKLVGTISLSKQNLTKKIASIGYEILPDFRHRGFAKQAFRAMLSYAKKRGFHQVHGKILTQNIASLKIWKPYNPKIETLNKEQLRLTINLYQ